nr:pirin family protein [Pluralibacter gergoviae]
MAMLPVPRQRISARVTDVGGIGVSRALPVRERRLIGAWCFLDHAGPAVFERGQEGMHVAPHPHVGLQTFTWMLDGEVLHRDSLGYRQIIRPGQVNLMTAGRGIAHSEDTAPGHTRLHAAQLWIALPDAARNMPPRFDHYPELPQWQKDAIDFTLLVGDAGGTAPRRCTSLPSSGSICGPVARRRPYFPCARILNMARSSLRERPQPMMNPSP